MLARAVCSREVFYSRTVARCTWESRGALGAASRVWAQGGDLSPAEIVCSSDTEPVGMGAVLALENWEELP